MESKNNLNNFQNNISIEARKLWNHMHQVHSDPTVFYSEFKFYQFRPHDFL